MATEPPVVVIECDNISGDNLWLAFLATHPQSGMNVAAIFVTSRHLSAGPTAEAAVLRYRARLMEQALRRLGRKTPVFVGGLFHSSIPETQHYNEGPRNARRAPNDRRYWMPPRMPSRNDGFAYLRGLKGDIHVLAGGPPIVTGAMLNDPLLRQRLWRCVIQGSVLPGSQQADVQLASGPGRSFNLASAPHESRQILLEVPELYVITSSTTKRNDLGLTLQQMKQARVHPEIVGPYEQHQALALRHTPERAGKPLYPHDAHLFFMQRQLMTGQGPYTWKQFVAVVLDKPLANDTLEGLADSRPLQSLWTTRYVVKDVDVPKFWGLLYRFSRG